MTLSVAAAALVNLWAGLIIMHGSEALDLLCGWSDAEAMLAAALEAGAPHRTSWLVGTSFVAVCALLGGVAAAYCLVVLVLQCAAAMASALLQTAAGGAALVRAIGFDTAHLYVTSLLIEPSVWVVFPTCACVAAIPGIHPALRRWWHLPAWWVLLNGRAWAVAGTLAVAAAAARSPHSIAPAAAQLWWTLLRCAVGWFRFTSSRVAAVLSLLFMAALGGILVITLESLSSAAADAAKATLVSAAPADATGEVARVLGSCCHYEVLGLDPEHPLDGEALRKAKLRKSLQVHPDKCPGEKHAQLAFERVCAAYDCLSRQL
jgi:hypothetical protein